MLFCLFLLLATSIASDNGDWGANQLGERVAGSRLMPEDLLCDSCIAIATQFHLAFIWAHRTKKLGAKPLPESELLHIMGDIFSAMHCSLSKT